MTHILFRVNHRSFTFHFKTYTKETQVRHRIIFAISCQTIRAELALPFFKHYD